MSQKQAVKTAREKRRANERAGTQIIFDPTTNFRCKMELSVPGGPLRGEYPRQMSQTLTATNEADLARGIFVTLIDAYGFTRIARAVTGMFCELVNPVSASLRQLILQGIFEGTGLDIDSREITSCVECGAEREGIDILDPHAEEGAELTQQDTTVHADECPCKDQNDGNEVKEPKWKTGPTVIIGAPRRYIPLRPMKEENDDSKENIIEVAAEVAEMAEPTDEELAEQEAIIARGYNDSE